MGFGDFDSICKNVAIPICSLVGPPSGISGRAGILPTCYARTVELANTIIFQGATSTAHIVALVMLAIMIIHVRSKFTAVGRKEITSFFYLYMLLTIISLIVDSGVVPPGSGAFPYFAAVQNGLASAVCASLLINGFVGFQLYEDGTALSVWLVRGSSVIMFLISGAISILTFKSWGGLGPENTIAMFVVLYIVNAIFLFIYVAMQVFLVVNTLQDRWPLGDILFGVFFFVVGQVVMYAASHAICNSASHYLDGLLFGTVCNLLAVMMIYKYWDSITKEDLEFSVSTKTNNWEVKDLLPEDERRGTVYHDTSKSPDNGSEYSSVYAARQQTHYSTLDSRY